MMDVNTSSPLESPERLRASQCSGSLGEEQYVLAEYFGRTRGGVFVELGAFDGWQESNTLHLESCLGWRGVLLDSPTHLDWLRHNRPAALSVGLAICPEAGLVNYSRQRATTAGIVRLMSPSVRRRFRVDGAGQEAVPCGPLGGLLASVGLTHVDFFSLDVQGAELMVLRTIDWRRLSVGVLIAECKGIACRDQQDAAVRALVETEGRMRWVGVLRARHDVWDAVFVNRSLARRRSARAAAAAAIVR